MQTDSISWLWVKSAKRRRVAITVTHAGAVEVKTPKQTPLEMIEQFLRLKHAWILKQQQRQEGRIAMTLPDFAPHGTLHFCGQKFAFVWVSRARAGVVQEAHGIIIYAKDEAAFHRTVLAWYAQETQKQTEHFLALHSPKVPKAVTSVAYKKFKRRWGSCDHKNGLLFNKLLSLLPLEQIEYVVVHELAHLVHKHHKKAFWDYGEALLAGFGARHRAML